MKRGCDPVKLCVIFVFLLILVVGLCVFDDYGLSTDETMERDRSVMSYRTVNRILLQRDVYSNFGEYSNINTYWDRDHGVALQLPFVFFEDMYQMIHGEEMPIYYAWQMRHLGTFLIYYFALLCFYALLKHLFHNRGLALAGVLMLFLFGRFFAQSFYNIKDMVCASMTMVTLCCTERMFFHDRKSIWCLAFALSSALLVTTRIIGALIIVFVLTAMLAQDLMATRQSKREIAPMQSRSIWRKLLPYALVCCAYPIWIVLTPAAWGNPIAFSFYYIQRSANYNTWTGTFAFAGALINETCVPSRYFITWICLTVPIVNQLLCLLGIGCFVAKPKQDGVSASGRTVLWLSLFMLAATIGYQFLTKPVVYGGWRHAYYLYSMIILFAVFALWRLWTLFQASRKVWLQAALVCVLVGSLGYNAYRIAQNHPNEYAMFNVIGREYAVGFERDYWMMTCKDMAKWVLDNDDKTTITIGYYDPAELATPIIDVRVYASLTEEEGSRLAFCYNKDAEYVFVNYTYLPGINTYEIDGFREVHAIWVDETKLASVYRRISKEE